MRLPRSRSVAPVLFLLGTLLLDGAAEAQGPPSLLPERATLGNSPRQFIHPTGGAPGGGMNTYPDLGYTSSVATPLTRLWTRFVDGPPAGVDDQASALTVDGNGFVYVVGSSGLMPAIDYLTVKYAPNGDTIWTRRYDGSIGDTDFGHACALDQKGNLYVTGASVLTYPYYDYLTIKYAPNGDTLWTRRYDGSAADHDFAFAIAVDGDGNAYVTGQTNGTEGDITTIKYTPRGDVAWLRTFDGPAHGDDRANVMVFDPAGNVIVAGWSFTSSGSWDFITLKYDLSGNQLWSRQWNGTGNSADQAFGLGVDAAGNVFVAGRSVGTGTGFDCDLVKYDPSGTFLWSRRLDGAAHSRDDAYACTVDAGGSCYVTGFCTGAGGSEDIVTAKYAPNGDSVWVRCYDGPAHLDDYAYAVMVDQRGLVYVGGMSNGGPTSYDIMTLVYLPNGDLVGEDRINGTANSYDGPGSSSYPTRYLAVDAAGSAYITGFVSNLGAATDFVTIKYAPATVDVTRSAPTVSPGIVPTIVRVAPNPIAGRGVARIEAPEATNLSLELLDVRGARRAVFWNQRSTAAGSYDVGLDVTSLPPGMYFLRLSARAGSESRRIVVVR